MEPENVNEKLSYAYGETLDDMYMIIKSIEKKLRPILSESMPQETAPDRGCDMLNELSRFRDTLEDINQRIKL